MIFEDSQNGFKASKAANIPFIDVTIYPFKRILEEFRISMNNIRTVAIIVTHNRSKLLKRCLINLKNQTQKVDKILVINNGSTDDTQEILNALGIDSIKQANLGSAGGWNTGLKYALKQGFDAAWLMDDDGYPDKNAYQILKNSFTKDMSCISSVVINEFDKSKFVFPYPLFNKNGIPK